MVCQYRRIALEVPSIVRICHSSDSPFGLRYSWGVYFSDDRTNHTQLGFATLVNCIDTLSTRVVELAGSSCLVSTGILEKAAAIPRYNEVTCTATLLFL